MLKTFKILLLVLSLSLPSLVLATTKVKTISGKKLYSMIVQGSGLWLVDVRGPISYSKKHIVGSMNISPSFFKYEDLPKEKIIVLADSSLGLKNAVDGAEFLTKSGYEKVYILKGGILKWEKEGLPMVVEENTPMMKVDALEFKEALKNNIPLYVYDLRENDITEKGIIDNSLLVKGKTFDKKIKKLKKMIEKTAKKNLAKDLIADKSIVLVLPKGKISDEVYVKLGSLVNKDIRYLEGGYNAWAAKSKKVVNGCPACSKKSTEGEGL